MEEPLRDNNSRVNPNVAIATHTSYFTLEIVTQSHYVVDVCVRAMYQQPQHRHQ